MFLSTQSTSIMLHGRLVFLCVCVCVHAHACTRVHIYTCMSLFKVVFYEHIELYRDMYF